jgi:predicted Zn-dependent peptidase
MGATYAGFTREDVGGTPLLWARDDSKKTLRCVLLLRRTFDDHAAARALLPSLLLQGTERDRDRVALARRMEHLYGALAAPGQGKSGEAHVLRATLDSVAGEFLPDRPDQLGAGLGLLADLLVRPLLDQGRFPQKAFERERRLLVNSVRGQVDDKPAHAYERAVELGCAGEPFARPEHGGVDAILALSTGDPEDARRDFLARGERLVLAYGRLPEQGPRAQVAGFLAQLPAASPERVPPATVVAARAPRRAVERTRLQQARLVLLFRWHDPHRTDLWPARRLLVGALGGGPHSLFFQEVREKRSLCYDIGASPERHKGLVVVQTGLLAKHAEETEATVLAQIANVRGGELADDVLTSAKQAVLAALRALDDSVAQRLAFVAEQFQLGVDETPESLAARYERVTREQVTEAAGGLWLDHVYLLEPEAEAAA